MFAVVSHTGFPERALMDLALRAMASWSVRSLPEPEGSGAGASRNSEMVLFQQHAGTMPWAIHPQPKTANQEIIIFILLSADGST